MLEAAGGRSIQKTMMSMYYVIVYHIYIHECVDNTSVRGKTQQLRFTECVLFYIAVKTDRSDRIADPPKKGMEHKRTSKRQ